MHTRSVSTHSSPDTAKSSDTGSDDDSILHITVNSSPATSVHDTSSLKQRSSLDRPRSERSSLISIDNEVETLDDDDVSPRIVHRRTLSRQKFNTLKTSLDAAAPPIPPRVSSWLAHEVPDSPTLPSDDLTSDAFESNPFDIQFKQPLDSTLVTETQESAVRPDFTSLKSFFDFDDSDDDASTAFFDADEFDTDSLQFSVSLPPSSPSSALDDLPVRPQTPLVTYASRRVPPQCMSYQSVPALRSPHARSASYTAKLNALRSEQADILAWWIQQDGQTKGKRIDGRGLRKPAMDMFKGKTVTNAKAGLQRRFAVRKPVLGPNA